jgi:nicotinamide riboside kinase
VLSGKTKRVVNRAAKHLDWRDRPCAAANRHWARIYAGCTRAWTNPRRRPLSRKKLARLIYILLTKRIEYIDQGQGHLEERYRQRVLHNLAQRAAKMGMKVVPVKGAA